MDYLGYFKLKEPPFALTPDPSFLFLTDAHKQALEGLATFVTHGEGYAVLSGDIGTGKTTVCRALLERLGPRVEAALVVNPFLDEAELLGAIAMDFGIEVPLPRDGSGRQKLMDKIREFLVDAHSQGKRALVVMDEAHNLPVAAMEQLRIVGNLETNKEKLLQVLLVGQTELIERLSGPRVTQLHQRIARWFKLAPLSRDDIEPYFQYRLEHAGLAQKLRLNREACALAYKMTGGYPRRLNMLFGRALQLVADRGKWGVEVSDIRRAGEELPPQAPPPGCAKPPSAIRKRLLAGVAVLGLATAAFGVGYLARDLPPLEEEVGSAAPFAPATSQKSRWAVCVGTFATQEEGSEYVLKVPLATGTRRFLVPQKDGTYLACIGYFSDREKTRLFQERLESQGVDADIRDASVWIDSKVPKE